MQSSRNVAMLDQGGCVIQVSEPWLGKPKTLKHGRQLLGFSGSLEHLVTTEVACPALVRDSTSL